MVSFLRMGQATEEILRICLKTNRVCKLSDLVDMGNPFFKKEDKAQKLEKIKRLIKKMFDSDESQYECFSSTLNELYAGLDEFICQKFPDIDFDPDQ